MIGAHRSNLQAMLQNVETQLDDQAAQLDSLACAIRLQLQSHRVPLDVKPVLSDKLRQQLPPLPRARLSGLSLRRGGGAAQDPGRARTGWPG
jgi:hypothetical protein